ncbi:MAG: glycoside hydrolase family 57 protein [Thermodesulfovibrio sp.]|uniref:Glycoside hydrolase n=2 Tax=Thermodesulfovibrio TaxID=28261 RepID=A0A2J6WQI0_9BACT|nr:MAG: glycoside hydrolase [Thermodesulfovibrio aggregans]
MSISLAILWHMHQPYYHDTLKNKFMLPWVRLHATKDYLDMLLILKNFPQVKVSFNLVPSLLKQLKEYEAGITDIFFEYSLIPAEELNEEQKAFIIENFFLANWKTMVEPFPRYKELLEKRGKIYGDPLKLSKKFTSQELRDLQTLFNLVWIDPLHRQQDLFLKELQKKGANFSEEEKKLLLEKHLELIKQIIPAYKEMALSGQIELTVSPFYHPILPLIYDNYKAKECMPLVKLPQYNFQAPEDAEAQINKAVVYFEELFGFKPQGMWPSEGAVSEEIIRLISKAGIKWTATDEEILAKSINENLRTGDKLINPSILYQPYEFEEVKIFFRDRVLSDLIGFVYSNWEPQKAVNDFLKRIRNSTNSGVVSVILDGENAWEYYENDGEEFLKKLYESLQKSKDIKTVTFSEYIQENPVTKKLKKIFPGSWIGANFSIWIGHEEDNLAWDYLYKVRKDLVSFQKENPDKNLSEAWEQIYISEGSDWNWWYGDEHYTETKDVFDEIYRHNLISVYLKTGKEPPAFLYVPISKKIREIKPEVEPKGFIYPKIDGKVTGYFEWLEAGRFNLQRIGGSMHKSESLFSYFYYGFNRQSLFLRLDPKFSIKDYTDMTIQIQIIEPKRIKIIYETMVNQLAKIFIQENETWIKKDEIDSVAFDEILEIELPFNVIEIKQEENICIFIEILKNSYLIDRAPIVGFIKIHVPPPDFDKLMWF